MTEQNNNTEESKQNSNTDGVVTVDSRYRCVTVIGQIEGHNYLPDNVKATRYEHLIPLLVDTEENNSIDGLLLILNTVGGDVEAGLAIAELIAGSKKPSVSLVLGGGHSIGVPLAVSCKKSFIAPSATMTLHPVRINGVVIGSEQSYRGLDRMQQRVISFITTHSNVSEKGLRKLILNTSELANDMGTTLNGDEAVSYGIIDRVGGIADAIFTLKEMCRESGQ